MVSKLTEGFYPYTLTILRIMTGLMFWQHGLNKLGFLEGRVQEFPELLWFAMVLEAFGGPLIVLGLFTRPLAFLLSGEMVVAYFVRHFPEGFYPLLNGGERAVLFCFIYLLLVTAGPGKLSVDGWIREKLGPRWWM